MAAYVSPGVSSAARKASRLNPSCAATSHSCSAQPHAPEAGVSRAPLLSAPRTETESSSVSAPPGVRRSRSLALPDGATELEVQVGPGNGESSSAALLGNGELSSAALAEALARAPLSAVLGFSSPQLLGLEHLEAPLSALLEEALNALGLESNSSDARAVLAKYDTNQDGKIDFAEFTQYYNACIVAAGEAVARAAAADASW